MTKCNALLKVKPSIGLFLSLGKWKFYENFFLIKGVQKKSPTVFCAVQREYEDFQTSFPVQNYRRYFISNNMDLGLFHILILPPTYEIVVIVLIVEFKDKILHDLLSK